MAFALREYGDLRHVFNRKGLLTSCAVDSLKYAKQCEFISAIYINQEVVFQLQAEGAIEHALSILIRVSLILLTRGNRKLNPEHPAHAHAVLEEGRSR